MKTDHRFQPPGGKPLPFEGKVRYYHRAQPRQDVSWESWVNGQPPASAKKAPINSSDIWLRVIVITVGMIAMVAAASAFLLSKYF